MARLSSAAEQIEPHHTMRCMVSFAYCPNPSKALLVYDFIAHGPSPAACPPCLRAQKIVPRDAVVMFFFGVGDGQLKSTIVDEVHIRP